MQSAAAAFQSTLPLYSFCSDVAQPFEAQIRIWVPHSFARSLRKGWEGAPECFRLR